jgi:UDP-N-acetylmuramoyl-tripeptide--D-alanyl-D-alanine ligase
MSYIQILLALTMILFLFKALSDALHYLWLFQVEEYRLDRMKSYLRENIKFNPGDIAVAAGFFILLTLLFPATARFLLVIALLLLGLVAPFYFCYGFVKSLQDLRKHSFTRPKPTLKILLIGAASFLLYGGFIFYLFHEFSASVNIIYSFDLYLILSATLLLLYLAVPLFLLLATFLVTPLSDYQKRKIIARATEKMREMKHVKTIGITGSYGKTSTKEFLYAILSAKFKVVKTEGNNNTQMGVAKTVLERVSDDYNYFICEMGAYRIGEIKEISTITQPFAGLLTGINQQHLGLFGSLENTKRAKYELIESLPTDGFAVINDQTTELKPHIKFQVKDAIYYCKDMMENIRVKPDCVEFRYEGTDFTAPILGKHYIENLLAAIITAEKLGMGLEDIREAVAKLDAQEDYLMKKLNGPHDSIFIDDSYSANPDGVIAALEYMEDAYPAKKKILVFPGIIELGSESDSIHRRIWEKTSDICSFAFILKDETEGISKKKSKCRFVFEKDFDKMEELVQKRIDKNTILLFESRGAGVVMKKILEHKKK